MKNKDKLNKFDAIGIDINSNRVYTYKVIKGRMSPMWKDVLEDMLESTYDFIDILLDNARDIQHVLDNFEVEYLDKDYIEEVK